MPPRLGELLQRRLDALSDAGREAVDVLALGEPLPYETLSAVVREDAILELDRGQIVTSDERDGVLLLRFSHPLLHAVAERRLSAARRRSLARRLRDAPAEHVDVVRRATWEDAGGGEPNVELLLAAADAVLLNDPAAALRLANRARQAGGGVKAAVDARPRPSPSWAGRTWPGPPWRRPARWCAPTTTGSGSPARSSAWRCGASATPAGRWAVVERLRTALPDQRGRTTCWAPRRWSGCSPAAASRSIAVGRRGSWTTIPTRTSGSGR